jgi:hypothetical protein
MDTLYKKGGGMLDKILASFYEKKCVRTKKQLLEKDQYHYPMFKIIDNYFWHEGYKLEKN